MSWESTIHAQVAFDVTCKVRGKQRPFVTSRGAFTPRATLASEAEIREAFHNIYRNRYMDWDDEVNVYIAVCREYPKSSPAYKDHEPDIHKPDADNIAKLVLDALTGTAWKDDAQVTLLKVTKEPRVSGRKDQIHVLIRYIQNRSEIPNRKTVKI